MAKNEKLNIILFVVEYEFGGSSSKWKVYACRERRNRLAWRVTLGTY